MNFKDLDKQLLKESIRIAENLIDKVQKDKFGIYWKTMGIDSESNIYFAESESIYSGVCGIALFFNAMYITTNDKKYLDIAESALNRIYYLCMENPTNYFALYTGRLSVSYTMLKLYETTKDKRYKVKALELARNCEDFLDNSSSVDDLINGLSGAILGLLHLHQATKEKWLISIIEKYVEKLIANSNFASKNGLYWDRSNNQIRGLCGFSHGAAGIGFVFLELGKYFENSAFFKISELAFQYESSWYSEDKGNWQDLRQSLYSEKEVDKLKEEYLLKNFNIFVNGKDMNAWCHGAAGIGHSRIEAYKVLGKEKYKNDYINAIEKVKKTDIEYEKICEKSFTLCHGSGGNADLFIEAFLAENNKDYFELAKKVGENGLKSSKQHQYYPGFSSERNREDLSLFMGNAGIGYFYLRLLNPKLIQSILSLPVIGSFKVVNENSILNINKLQLMELLLKKPFNKTLENLKQQERSCFELIFNTENNELFANPVQTFTRIMKKIESKLDEKTNDIFKFENNKLQLDFKCKSHSLLYISDLVAFEKYENIDNNLNGCILKLNDLCTLSYTKYSSQSKESKMSPVLLKATALEVREYPLDEFCYSIVELANGYLNYEEIEGKILIMFGKLSKKQESFVKLKLKAQVISLLKANILCCQGVC